MKDAILEDSLELLRKMVAIPSFSKEEQAVSALVCGFLSECGIGYEMVGRNILAANFRFDPHKPTLVLDAHLDTVRPAESYTRDPFDAGTDTGTIFGLGSNDDGGSVVSMIAAFRHFHGRDIPVNLFLSLTVEEEISGTEGAAYVYGGSGFFKGCSPLYVIIGEPTGMKAATSERGLIVLDGTAAGVSGHAAREEGVNALYIALDDIAALRSHRFAKHSGIMGDVKLNVTQMECGTAHNVIPDTCRFVVDVRPTDVYRNSEVVEELRSICKSALEPRSLRHASSATYVGSPLLAAAADMQIETFSSPTTSNWMLTGCDSIKMGPGDSARSHRADEFIKVSEIEDAVNRYTKYIETFYGYFME